MAKHDIRPGEIALARDPAAAAADASLVFIGRIRSPWTDRDSCPKSLREARERGGEASLLIDEPWRAGLAGLTPGMPLVVLYWMHAARRDLIVQAPRHKASTAGVFSLRSPVRPNPIALAVVRCLALDQTSGQIAIDAIDAIDGTPVLDVKPWLASIDVPPDN